MKKKYFVLHSPFRDDRNCYTRCSNFSDIAAARSYAIKQEKPLLARYCDLGNPEIRPEDQARLKDDAKPYVIVTKDSWETHFFYKTGLDVRKSSSAGLEQAIIEATEKIHEDVFLGIELKLVEVK